MQEEDTNTPSKYLPAKKSTSVKKPARPSTPSLKPSSTKRPSIKREHTTSDSDEQTSPTHQSGPQHKKSKLAITVDYLCKSMSTIEKDELPVIEAKKAELKKTADKHEAEIQDIEVEVGKYEAQMDEMEKTLDDLRRRKRQIAVKRDLSREAMMEAEKEIEKKKQLLEHYKHAMEGLEDHGEESKEQ